MSYLTYPVSTGTSGGVAPATNPVLIASSCNFFIPDLIDFNGPPALNGITFSNSTNKVAYTFQSNSSGPISTIGFCMGSMGQAGTLTVSIQTVDTTNGNPTGTFFTGTTTFLNIAVSDSFSWKTVTLSTSAFVNAGSLCSIVIHNSAAYTGTALGIVFNRTNFSTISGFPYANQQSITTWTKQVTNPVFSYQYSDGFIPKVYRTYPMYFMGSFLISTATQGALKFSLPFNCRAVGAWSIQDNLGDSQIILYGNDGSTLLASINLDKDFNSAATPGTRSVNFVSATTLLANTFYRLSFAPSTATSSKIYYLDASTENLFDALSIGRNGYYSQAGSGPTGNGSWTDTTTRRPFMGLIVDQIDP